MFCFIPSKNRPNTKTFKLFEAANITPIHFLEPQDFDKYQVPNKINILKNNQGISYVRNFMIDYAKTKNLDWVIFCDDDVSSFGIYKDKKTIKKGAEIWLEILDKVKNMPFEIVGVNYCQYAWLEKTACSINKKFAEVCIAVNVKKINWKYELDTKEDRDFQMQTIKNGSGVIRFNYFWFKCPPVGSNEGGLQNLYKQKKDTDWAKKMVIKYHPFAKLSRKKDRIDAKIDIKGYAKFFGKLVK